MITRAGQPAFFYAQLSGGYCCKNGCILNFHYHYNQDRRVLNLRFGAAS